MAITWSISANGVSQTVAAWGITGLKRQRRSAEASTVTFTAPGLGCDQPALFAPKSTVAIYCGSVCWFTGRVTKVPVNGSARAENQEYELSDPWWYLDNLVCRQTWYVEGQKETALSTRLILGQALTGANITTGAVILETLTYALNAGAPFEIGTIDPNLYIPLIEVKDATCADVIKAMLRWHPDCIAYFDYSTTPKPTLHMRLRANLSVATLPFGSAPRSAIGQLTPRYELQPPAVIINYEQTGNQNGAATFTLTEDAFPAGANGYEFGTIICTVPLAGVSSTTVQQRVVTQGIYGADADGGAPNWNDPGLLNYLASLYAPLQMAINDPNITAAGITLQAAKDSAGNTIPYRALCINTLAPPSSDTPPNAVPDPVGQVFDTSLLNELVDGSITDWMRTNYGVKAQQQRLTFGYTLDSGDGSSGDTSISSALTAHIDRVATNAGTGQALASQTYQLLSSYNPGDAVPVGIAESYFASLSQLQYSGVLTLVEEEASGAAVLGQTINLTGSGNAGWSAMAALIVEETVEVDTGTTTLTVGPPEHLSPQDLVDRLRIARPEMIGGRTAGSPAGQTPNSSARTTGAPAATTMVPGNITSPIQNSCPAPGSPMLWCQLPVNGQIAYAQFAMTTPVAQLPQGAMIQNPD